jgi:hypothetical protein
MTDSFMVDVLARAKKQYDQGDKTQILECLNLCFVWHEPTPPWLEQAFANAYGAKSEGKIKSWDEVFGRPFKKGTQPAREYYKKRIVNDLYKRVVERHDGGAGEPIDKKLFESVGKEFGVGGTVASELYYGDVTFLGLPIRPRKLPEKIKKPRKFPGKLKNIREY